MAAPASGLGGIDSRPCGKLPQVATLPGWRVVHCGTVYTEELNGFRVEHLIRLERSGMN